MSYADIVLPELQDRLLAIRDGVTGQSWDLGDIALEVSRGNPGEKRTVVYQAVASFAGVASRTVREYATIAKFYPPSKRLEFDALSFNHFRRAMRLDDPYGALGWCLDQTDELNRPATVDAMDERFRVDRETSIGDRIHSAILRLQSLANFAEPPEDVMSAINAVIDKLEWWEVNSG